MNVRFYQLIHRLAFAIIAVGIVAAAQVPTASGDIVRNGRFVFFPRISEGDPVNIVWYGGEDNYSLAGSFTSFCRGVDARSFGCAEEHIQDNWSTMSPTFCSPKGESSLQFLKAVPGTGKTTPGDEASLTTKHFCRTEYHIRLWGDGPHGHTVHRWVVTPIHHEKPPCRFCIFGHHIDKEWEVAEFDAIQFIGGGPQRGNLDRCTYRDWRAFPGTAGTIHGHYSDGFISRISWQNTGAGCSGA
jgi:hypothetical protein